MFIFDSFLSIQNLYKRRLEGNWYTTVYCQSRKWHSCQELIITVATRNSSCTHIPQACVEILPHFLSILPSIFPNLTTTNLSVRNIHESSKEGNASCADIHNVYGNWMSITCSTLVATWEWFPTRHLRLLKTCYIKTNPSASAKLSQIDVTLEATLLEPNSSSGMHSDYITTDSHKISSLLVKGPPPSRVRGNGSQPGNLQKS